MSRVILSLAGALAFCICSHAETRTERYTSVARDKNGAEAYQEKHEVLFSDRSVQKANTQYLDPKGHLIGEMTSDFTKMVTIPDYEYKNLRTGTSNGIKLDKNKITLWRKAKNGKIENIDFFRDKFSNDALIVGCQGLHYYLIDNLEHVKEMKTVPVVYFIPGKLDYYKFSLKYDRDDEKYIYLTISIDNFLLRLFSSKLDLKYSKSDRHLVQFSGLSNITNESDQMQNVVIDYKYDSHFAP